MLLLASSSPWRDRGLDPGESLQHVGLGRGLEVRLGLPGQYGKESLSQRLGLARRGSTRKVLCPPAVFAGGWMFARRDARGVGWGWAVGGFLVRLQLEDIHCSRVGQRLVHCAGLRLVLLICMARVPIARCQVPLCFRVARGKRQGLLEQKGRGGKFGKVLCHQVGLGLVIRVWFTLAATRSP